MSYGVGAGAWGEDEQALILPGGGENLTVEVDDADSRMHDAFTVATAYGDVVAVPQPMGPHAAVLVPSDHVRALTGNPARPFAAWVSDNAQAFA